MLRGKNISTVFLISLTLFLSNCSDPMNRKYSENSYDSDIIELEEHLKKERGNDLRLIRNFVEINKNKMNLENKSYQQILENAKDYEHKLKILREREQDSIKALIAFGPLKFGDSEEVVKNKLQSKKNFGLGKDLGEWEYYKESYYTRSGLYNFKIITFFNRSKLNSINLSLGNYFCSNIDNYYIGQTKYNYERALEYFSSKYGNQRNNYPDLSDWRVGYGKTVVTNKWKVLNTTVELSIKEVFVHLHTGLLLSSIIFT